MPRPFKCRYISCEPLVDYFKPRGIPMHSLEEVNLTLDEFEAIRLADLEGLYQEQAAEKMNVSRQTFGNIINSAHKKIADSLVNGKSIAIEGGFYKMAKMRRFECHDCSHRWEIAHGTGRPQQCPGCSSKNIHRAEDDRDYARTRCHGFGKCRRI
jgi:predicted DNA-binding protein (UPF0251 family)